MVFTFFGRNENESDDLKSRTLIETLSQLSHFLGSFEDQQIHSHFGCSEGVYILWRSFLNIFSKIVFANGVINECSIIFEIFI